MEYIAYLHKGRKSDFGVSFPDFPGCVTAGKTLEEARRMAVEALSLHIEGMMEDGEAIPQASTLDALAAEKSSAGLEFSRLISDCSFFTATKTAPVPTAPVPCPRWPAFSLTGVLAHRRSAFQIKCFVLDLSAQRCVCLNGVKRYCLKICDPSSTRRWAAAGELSRVVISETECAQPRAD